MQVYAPAVLDVLARAYDRALDALPVQLAPDMEVVRARLLRGLLDAAGAGERDETALAMAALRQVGLSAAEARADLVDARMSSRSAAIGL